MDIKTHVKVTKGTLRIGRTEVLKDVPFQLEIVRTHAETVIDNSAFGPLISPAPAAESLSVFVADKLFAVSTRGTFRYQQRDHELIVILTKKHTRLQLDN